MTIGSAAVKIVPDARGFTEKLKAQLRDLEAKVHADADTAEAKAKLDETARKRTATIKADADTAEATEKLDRAARTRTAKMKVDADTSGVERKINWLSTALITAGPAAIPAAGAAVAGAAGLAGSFGAAALAAGTAKLAFTGVGTALSAANKQAIEPSTANLKAMHTAMATLPPSARGFVREVASLRPQLEKLRQSAGHGLFSGLTAGIHAAASRFPQLDHIVAGVGTALGKLAHQAGVSLGGPAWDKFFRDVQVHAGPALMTLGHTIGNVIGGLRNLGTAMAPVFGQMGHGMEGMSRSFERWTSHLGHNQGFQHFLSYIQTEGPKVGHTLMAVGRAVGHVVAALAPLGNVSLAGIRGIANVLSRMPAWAITGVAAGLGIRKLGNALQDFAGKHFSLPGLGGSALGGKSGVVPVYVTNEGFGKGPGGAGGPVGGGGLTKAEREAQQAEKEGSRLSRLGGKLAGIAKYGSFLAGMEAFVAAQVAVPVSRNMASRASGQYGFSLKGARYADYLKALNDSNVGKNSKDLGVNINKLAAQLATKGVNSPYAKQLDKKWRGDQGGLGSILNTLDFGLTGKQGKEADATLALEKIMHQGVNKFGIPVGTMMKQIQMVGQYGKQLKTLPKAVQTKVLAPGAQLSGKQVGDLAQKYHLTPKQVTTLVKALGAEGALSAAEKLGRQYGLTPKKVDTIIAQTAMNHSQAEIQHLAHLYNITPKQVRTLINAKDDASGLIRRIQAEINAMHGTSVAITTIRNDVTRHYSVNSTKPPSSLGGLLQRAGGGPVYGPGTATSDSVLARLSNGEYVVNAKAYAANRELVQSINTGTSSLANYRGAYAGSAPYRPEAVTAARTRTTITPISFDVDGMEMTALMRAVVHDEIQ